MSNNASQNVIQRLRSNTFQDKTPLQKKREEIKNDSHLLPAWQIIRNVDKSLQMLARTNRTICSTKELLKNTKDKVNESIFQMDRYIDYKNASLTDEEYKNLLVNRKKAQTVNLPLKKTIIQQRNQVQPLICNDLIKKDKKQTVHEAFYQRNYYQFLNRQKNGNENSFDDIRKRRHHIQPIQPKVVICKSSKGSVEKFIKIDMEKLRHQQEQHVMRITQSRQKSRSRISSLPPVHNT